MDVGNLRSRDHRARTTRARRCGARNGRVLVPSLIGATGSAACERALALGLYAICARRPAQSGDSTGVVLAQVPVAGSSARRGDALAMLLGNPVPGTAAQA